MHSLSLSSFLLALIVAWLYWVEWRHGLKTGRCIGIGTFTTKGWPASVTITTYQTSVILTQPCAMFLSLRCGGGEGGGGYCFSCFESTKAGQPSPAYYSSLGQKLAI